MNCRENENFLSLSSDDPDEEHNYSVTNRWRKRSEVWKRWEEENVLIEGFQVERLRLPNRGQLFLTDDDDSSPLGKKLAWLQSQLDAIKARLGNFKRKYPGDDEVIQEYSVDSRENFEGKAFKVEAFIGSISEKHASLRNKFDVVKNKGNETVLTVPTKQPSVDKERITLEKVGSPGDFADIRPITDAGLRDELIKAVDDATQATLKLFQDFVARLFQNAKKGENEEHVKNTISAILKWEKEGDGSLIDETIEYARPPTSIDREDTVDHPILHAVICRIIRVLASGESEITLHEYEYCVSTEQSVAVSKHENLRERQIDVTAHEAEECLPSVLPAMLQQAFEFKTFPDCPAKLQKSLEKGRSQIVGHLGKILSFSFDFGGVGKDSYALGTVLTPLSIEVVKMTLSDVGTEEVDLRVIGTGCLPLLGKDYLDRHAKHAMSLISSDVSEGEEGFVLLAGALIRAAPTALAAPTFPPTSVRQSNPEEELVFTQFLGSGAFSNVARLRGQGEFLKMPKAAALAKNLTYEAKILQSLNSQDCHIPKLVYESGVTSIRTVIRGEVTHMVFLRLHGIVGVALNKLPRGIWEKSATSIITTISEALRFAHEKGIYHLDVRPGNIIVKTSRDGHAESMLSDWGCSIATSQKLSKFRGCTPYAHDSFFSRASVQPRPELDFASLAYTMAHVEQGVLKWAYEFDRPTNVKTADLNIRRGFMIEFFEEEASSQRFGNDVLAELRTACGVDRRSSSRSVASS